MKRNILYRVIAFVLVINLSAAMIPQANAATNIRASDVVSTANSLVGKYPNYVWGGYSPANGGFDCTGLVYYVYHTCLGYNMTLAQARSKSQILGLGTKVTNKSALLPGDIIQYTISHVGIYIGNNTVIHSGTTYGVSKVSINSTALTFDYAIRLTNITQDGSGTAGTIGNSSPINIPTVKSTETGKWTVNIPANYKLVCYDSANATRSSAYYIAAKTTSYKLTCTQKATLSNGKIRYFFVSGDKKNLWFDYTSGMSVTPSGSSVTVTPYTVTFNANGGSVSQSSKSVTSGQKYGTLPMPSRNGYTFDGWYTSASGGTQVTAATTVNLTGNQTLYAHWTENPIYTVTFDPIGGNVSQNSKTVTYGSNYGTLPTPTRSGYTFDGWYTSADGGSLVTSNVTVRLTYNQTLYAHWSENKQTYTLYFDPDGGSVDITSKQVTYGEYYGELPTPYREGYKFEGWRTGRNGTGSLRVSGKYVTTKSDETVYAHWSLIDTRIRVHFDTNGGPDHGYLYYYESNDTYGNLPSTEWVGYIFEGWYTKPTGGTKIYSTTKLIQDSEHTLYAHWRKEETPLEPSTLAISGLRVTVSNGKIRASASITSNYDLTDYSFSDGANSFGLGSVGQNRKTFEYTYEVDYKNRADVRAGTYTFQLTCSDMSGKSVTATYNYYLPDPNAPQYFNCNVGIFCINGKTVNLYNNPGDNTRVDYFSLGQSVGSTYGVNMPDGSTWYRVSVTSKGKVITVWLKYESDKMTIRNLG